MPRLNGPTVVLREYRRSDLEHINEFTKSEEITRNLSDIFLVPQSLAQTQTFLDRVMSGENANALYFVIADPADEAYIGQIDIMNIDWIRRIGTLGIVIADPARLGRGIGREAIALLAEYAFRRAGLRKIELSVFEFNERALRCYRACGFVEEGRLRGHALRDGVWYASIRMGLFEDEFLGSPAWKRLEHARSSPGRGDTDSSPR